MLDGKTHARTPLVKRPSGVRVPQSSQATLVRRFLGSFISSTTNQHQTFCSCFFFGLASSFVLLYFTLLYCTVLYRRYQYEYKYTVKLCYFVCINSLISPVFHGMADKYTENFRLLEIFDKLWKISFYPIKYDFMIFYKNKKKNVSFTSQVVCLG